MRLSILAYNVLLLPYPLDTGQKIRAGLIPEQLGGHDLLILSELFDLELRARVLDDLRSQYPYTTAVLGHRGILFTNGGLTIASRWPITAEDRRFFGPDHCTGMDCFAEKGVVYACLEKHGRRVHVFGSHTQASANAAAARVRQEQFKIVRGFIDEQHLAPDEVVLVGGDLNVDRLHDGAEYRRMIATLGARHARPRGPGGTFEPDENPLAKGPREEFLDYVLWSRDHLAPTHASLQVHPVRAPHPWRDGIRDLSDHHAVAAEFEFA